MNFQVNGIPMKCSRGGYFHKIKWPWSKVSVSSVWKRRKFGAVLPRRPTLTYWIMHSSLCTFYRCFVTWFLYGIVTIHHGCKSVGFRFGREPDVKYDGNTLPLPAPYDPKGNTRDASNFLHK